ncbi:MAG: hypothetical protein PWR25_1077 [Euryarchaeota archaeon]|jgi:hypothetical protein|nr:hypothetical protein [Euryarchaeota archaeon]MDN5340043.1 hypothetical protein [Euryarchaeota archaeon]
MPRVRINDGALPAGSGVEGGRKKKPEETPTPDRREPERETAKQEESRGKSWRRGPLFGSGDDADIFYTRTK